MLKSGLARLVQRNQRAWLAQGARWALHGAEPLPGRRSILHNNHRNVGAEIRADTSRGSSCLLPRRSARNASIKLPLSLDKLPLHHPRRPKRLDTRSRTHKRHLPERSPNPLRDLR